MPEGGIALADSANRVSGFPFPLTSVSFKLYSPGAMAEAAYIKEMMQ